MHECGFSLCPFILRLEEGERCVCVVRIQYKWSCEALNSMMITMIENCLVVFKRLRLQCKHFQRYIELSGIRITPVPALRFEWQLFFVSRAIESCSFEKHFILWFYRLILKRKTKLKNLHRNWIPNNLWFPSISHPYHKINVGFDGARGGQSLGWHNSLFFFCFIFFLKLFEMFCVGEQNHYSLS